MAIQGKPDFNACAGQKIHCPRKGEAMFATAIIAACRAFEHAHFSLSDQREAGGCHI